MVARVFPVSPDGLQQRDLLEAAVEAAQPTRTQHDAAVPLRLIGDAALCARYRRALALQGIDHAPTIEGATVAGLWQVASRAGLIKEGA